MTELQRKELCELLTTNLSKTEEEIANQCFAEGDTPKIVADKLMYDNIIDWDSLL